MQKLSRTLLFLLVFLIILQFFSGKKNREQNIDEIVLISKSKFSIGKEVAIEIDNQTETPIVVQSNCPKNPLEVEMYRNGEWILKEAEIKAALKTGDAMYKCSSCHRKEAVGKTMSLMDAFHIQCITCHREILAKGQKSGPVLCGKCHPWK